MRRINASEAPIGGRTVAKYMDGVTYFMHPNHLGSTTSVTNHLGATAGVNYKYDGDGRRVKKDNGKLYWYGLGGEVLTETDLSGNNPTEYVFFNGKRIGRRTSTGTVYYYFGDHLGTSRVIVQAGQSTPCYDADFYPFGVERPLITNNCPPTHKFTGKERDTETGNDYFGARFYASNLGRFLSGDPVSQISPRAAMVSNPQRWNAWANNQIMSESS